MTLPPAIDHVRLVRILGGPEMAPLITALARRLERDQPLKGFLRLMHLTSVENEAIARTMGRTSSSGGELRVDLGLIEQGLAEAGIAPSLGAAVHALRGPILSRRSRRQTEADAWRKVEASALEAAADRPEIASWMRHLFQLGQIRRLSGGDAAAAAALLSGVAQVVAALPASAEPLPALAARLFGTAHALDPGTPLATLTVRAAARLGKVAFTDNAEGRRAAWSSVGVLCDDLSAPVLVFNLRLPGSTPLGQLIGKAADLGEPVHVSARLLVRSATAGNGEAALRNRVVHVCENPSLVGMAARRLGSACAPLVCVSGQFATPALLLLRQLRLAGAALRVHADFDGAGLNIVRRVIAEGGAVPWRYGANDYLASPKGIALSGMLPETPWDPALRAAMHHEGKAVHEEAVAEALLQDLSQRGDPA